MILNYKANNYKETGCAKYINIPLTRLRTRRYAPENNSSMSDSLNSSNSESF